MKTKLKLALMAGALGLAVQANASLVGNPTVGPGNSVDVTWTDGNNGTIDAIEAIIVSGGGVSFDQAATASEAGWTGYLLNSTATFLTGPAFNNNQTLTLSFADSTPSSGVVVDFYYWLAGNSVPADSWQYVNLTGGSEWQSLSSPSPAEPAVPEPTTILSGVLMLLPFGASTLRIMRRKQVA